jgi:hypothetical protein
MILTRLAIATLSHTLHHYTRELRDSPLALPAFCLAEPLDTLGRRHKERRQLQEGIQKEVHQLRRSDHYREALQDVDLAATLFALSAQQDVARMERLYRRLAKTGHLVPLTAQVTLLAFDLRREFDLNLPDAFVLASVSDHLVENAATSAFVTKNTKDFDDPGVRDYLNGRGCQLLTSFGQAMGFALEEG